MKKQYRVMKAFRGYVKGQTKVFDRPLTFELADTGYLKRHGFIEEILEPGADTVEVMMEEPEAEYAVKRIGRPRGRPKGSKNKPKGSNNKPKVRLGAGIKGQEDFDGET